MVTLPWVGLRLESIVVPCCRRDLSFVRPKYGAVRLLFHSTRFFGPPGRRWPRSADFCCCWRQNLARPQPLLSCFCCITSCMYLLYTAYFTYTAEHDNLVVPLPPPSLVRYKYVNSLRYHLPVDAILYSALPYCRRAQTLRSSAGYPREMCDARDRCDGLVSLPDGPALFDPACAVSPAGL